LNLEANMRHELSCLAVIAFAGLAIRTVQTNVAARQCGYRIATNFSEADSLSQRIGSERDGCRRLLEMQETQDYIASLGLTPDAIHPPVQPDLGADRVAALDPPRGARRSQ
jgi:hypothetical protein